MITPDRLAAGCLVLERTPLVLRALLDGLDRSLTSANEGGESWSPFDIVGHLIDGEETDWIPRARIVLARDGEPEERRFAPFDRFRHLGLNRGRTLAELLDRFAQARADSLATLRGWKLSAAQLALTAEHPALGRVTLGELLATWVVHDLDHLAQISRVLARQYAGDVGVWREYLPVLASSRT